MVRPATRRRLAAAAAATLIGAAATTAIATPANASLYVYQHDQYGGDNIYFDGRVDNYAYYSMSWYGVPLNDSVSSLMNYCSYGVRLFTDAYLLGENLQVNNWTTVRSVGADWNDTFSSHRFQAPDGGWSCGF
jgi:hypothetical protein